MTPEPRTGRSAAAAKQARRASRPRVSVFSPSHQTRYLDDCLRSLLAQTYEDWEWIVVLNHGARWRPPVDDPRLRLVVQDDLAGVGAAKRHACSLALGEFLVELDHDDELRSDALTLVVEAFDAHPEVGLVFSNFAQINEDGSRDDVAIRRAQRLDLPRRRRSTAVRFCSATAWSRTPTTSATSGSRPNHVRAFRRSVYEHDGRLRRHP